MVIWFNPKEIRHLVLAEEQSLGRLNPVVVSESIGGVAVRFRARYSRMQDLLVGIVRNAPEWLASILERIYMVFE